MDKFDILDGGIIFWLVGAASLKLYGLHTGIYGVPRSAVVILLIGMTLLFLYALRMWRKQAERLTALQEVRR